MNRPFNALEFLKASTHANNTEVQKAALYSFAQHIRNEAQWSKQALLDSGLVDSFEEPEGFSAYYKKHLADAIDEKYSAQHSDDC